MSRYVDEVIEEARFTDYLMKLSIAKDAGLFCGIKDPRKLRHLSVVNSQGEFDEERAEKIIDWIYDWE